MTVENQTNKVTALGNDVATSFSFSPMVINEESELVVTHVDSNAAETDVPLGTGSTDFSVSVSSFPGTGSITYPAAGGTELATGAKLVIKRVLVLEQQVDLQNQGGYFPEVQETAFDKLTMMELQQQEELDRCFKIAVSVSGSFATELPSNIESFPGYAVIVNSAGDGLTLASSPGDATITSFWGTVLDDTTLSASLSSMGFASFMQAFLLDTTAADARAELDVLQDVHTTRGDMTAEGASGPVRVAVGSVGQALGSDGTDPAWVSPTVKGSISGMELTTGTDTAHDFDISAGVCRDAADTKSCIGPAYTKQFDSDFAEGTAAGGMSTSVALPTSGTVHFFIAEKDASPGTFDYIGDTSVTMANGVTGWTMRRRMGSRNTDGSDNFIGTTQNGDEVLLNTPEADFTETNPGTSAISRTMNIPIGVTLLALTSYYILDATPVGAQMLITSLDQSDTAPSSTINDMFGTTASEGSSTYKPVRTNTSAQVRTRVSASDGSLIVRGTTFGWIDTRGKDI